LSSGRAMDFDDLTRDWLSSLERRHLAGLTISEVARALRALSSCYVERRSKLVEGVALATAGKRAAFALFYGPLHFLIARHVTRTIPEACRDLREIVDLGCGTGGAGAAWAIEARAARVRGFDRHPWAIDEANATYRHFNIDGRAQQRDIGSPRPSSRDSYRVNPGTGVVAAYVANELTADGRAVLLLDLLSARRRGARILVIEPIARRALPWWDAWRASVLDAGGRADEWRIRASLPDLQRTLARAAGLDPRELTARSLFI
jgi:Methyltransferase small domain